jgi:hypothetical protein
MNTPHSSLLNVIRPTTLERFTLNVELEQLTIDKAEEYCATIGVSFNDFAVAAISWYLNP